MQDQPLDALDLRLIHSLQTRARIPWTTLGGVLGVDAATLMRRWRRLVERGLVYVSVSPSRPLGNLCLAYVEVGCQPSHLRRLIEQLNADPAAVSIDVAPGGRQLIVTTVGRSIGSVADWAFALGDDEHVTAIHTHHVATLVGVGHQWRPRALGEAEEKAIRSWGSQAPRAAGLAPTELTDLLEALTVNVRAPITELAGVTGVSTRRVSESLAWMMATDEIVFRIDVARHVTMWPIFAWYFLRVPAGRLTAVAQHLSGMAEMRSVSKTAGTTNLIAAFWLRSLEDMHHLEEAIEGRLREVVVDDRTVVTRTVKHIGHLLDHDGLATRGRVRIVPA